MASVRMWCAQTNVSSNAPGITASFVPNGVLLSGTQVGPPWPNFLTMAFEQLNIIVRAWYWAGPDRIPPGIQWQSLAVDGSAGVVTGTTTSGIFFFGPDPSTAVGVTHKHRVFSGSSTIPILEEDIPS